jgi:hypothetical protein
MIKSQGAAVVTSYPKGGKDIAILQRIRTKQSRAA